MSRQLTLRSLGREIEFLRKLKSDLGDCAPVLLQIGDNEPVAIDVSSPEYNRVADAVNFHLNEEIRRTSSLLADAVIAKMEKSDAV